MDAKDYIDFGQIKEFVGVKDDHLFIKYLKEVYKDLADRSDADKKKGIIKMTFFDYIKLPIFISEKVFNAFDEDKDNFLNPKEFVFGMNKLYNGTFKETVEIVFSLLDFNNDGIIEPDDVGMLLSYLPLKTDKINIEYKYQMESLDEIDEILKSTFEDKKGLKLDEFSSIVENRKSDIYLQILCFLYQKKPFSEENINVLIPKNHPHRRTSANLECKFLPSPNKRSSLSPASVLIQTSNLKSIFDLNSKGKTPEVSGISGMIRFHNENIPNKNYDENTNINDIIKDSKNIYQSPGKFLKGKKGKKVVPLSLESQLIQMEIDDENEKTNKKEEKVETPKKNDNNIDFSPDQRKKGSNNNLNDIPTNNEILYQDYIYKLSENVKLKKFYLVLIGKDIFYYKNENKEKVLGMHNLSGCYVKENGSKVFNKQTFYSFQLVFPTKVRNYYCISEEICDNFILNFKKAFGYLNFFDYYEMLGDLGEGIFGVVKLGLYKKTKERVAIKVIKKDTTKQNDMELVRTEIDIMKLCHHPNIVRLLDHFENAEYIFIVMEYIAGGDLTEYMKKNKYNFKEERVSQIIYQIAFGLKYLHHFGIIHRDLKPDNIMLTESNEKGIVKIMDFGLSKILGKNERSIEGFGTLTFVAPEVLIRTPYNKEIDIWSLGVTLYLMLSGTLPFDDENDNEEKIAKLAVYSEVKFPKNIWEKRSNEVIDLIKRCLIKEPKFRIKIDDILNHEWIKKYNSND